MGVDQNRKGRRNSLVEIELRRHSRKPTRPATEAETPLDAESSSSEGSSFNNSGGQDKGGPLAVIGVVKCSLGEEPPKGKDLQ